MYSTLRMCKCEGGQAILQRVDLGGWRGPSDALSVLDEEAACWGGGGYGKEREGRWWGEGSRGGVREGGCTFWDEDALSALEEEAACSEDEEL